MQKDAGRETRGEERAFTATFALLMTAVACAFVAIAAPRPVRPGALPGLRLDSALVAAQLARDRARAARATRDPDSERLLILVGEEGRAELTPRADLERLSARRAELAGLARKLFARLGAESWRALIAATVERAMRALSALEAGSAAQHDPEAAGLLGSFPRLLVRYGYADPRGRRLAPELSVRALYKARFNVICERPVDADLSQIELQAYEGWNALHAHGLAPTRRAVAARAFYAAGGQHGAEALAIWLFQGGIHGEALSLLRGEYARTGALRLRNLALFARVGGSE